MYHFLHKHRYWFFALAVLTAGALALFQLLDDGGLAPGVGDRPNEPIRAIAD